MSVISKKEADAYDRMLAAADQIFELITTSALEIDEYTLEEVAVFIAENGPHIRKLLIKLRKTWP